MGRFASPASGTAIPIGAPVVGDMAAGMSTDGMNLQIVKLAPQASAPAGGFSGVALYEYAPAAFAGNDPWLTTYSDKDLVPAGKALQVVSGPYVKFVLTNTVSRSFLGNRTYAGRTMVNGLGATPTVIVGDYLVPGAGDDNNGHRPRQAAPA